MSLRPSLLKSYTTPINLLSGRAPRRESDPDARWKARSSTASSNTTASRRLRHLTRFIPLRRLKLVLGIIAVITIILLAAPARIKPSQIADARHLDQLVSKVRAKIGSFELRHSAQSLLSSSVEFDDVTEPDNEAPKPRRPRGRKQGRMRNGIVGDIFLDQDEEDDWNYDEDEEDEDEADTHTHTHTHSEGRTQDSNDIQLEGEVDYEDDEDEEDAYGAPASRPYHGQYRQLFSLTTDDRKYFKVHFGGPDGYNPSVIPHPDKYDLWIVSAQHKDKTEQITCFAGFLDGTLTCTETPSTVPTEPSLKGSCSGTHAHFNMEPGARDARVFYGPMNPYILYGSQSQWTCIGVWLQDLRMLIEAYAVERHVLVDLFKAPMEIRRPPVPEYKDIEKNFFLFWDDNGKQYVHHELWPKRVFAQVDFDGSVGEDLGAITAKEDAVCMAQYMPSLRSDFETLQQATNSLMITSCKRKDPGCKPSNQNTFIATIIHHKSFYDFHAVHEPYLVLFNQTAPFNIFGIAQRPFWIHGRTNLTEDSFSKHYEGEKARNIPQGHSERFYMTSMSWKTHGQKYQGYADDPLLLSFGVEDTRGAAIDVLAGDLLQDIATC